jgi:hypothetical protein
VDHELSNEQTFKIMEFYCQLLKLDKRRNKENNERILDHSGLCGALGALLCVPNSQLYKLVTMIRDEALKATNGCKLCDVSSKPIAFRYDSFLRVVTKAGIRKVDRVSSLILDCLRD